MLSFTGKVESHFQLEEPLFVTEATVWVTFHSHPVGSNGRNNIVAVTPLEFLPIEEFEKKQKSINKNQTRAIMSSMLTKFGVLNDIRSHI